MNSPSHIRREEWTQRLSPEEIPVPDQPRKPPKSAQLLSNPPEEGILHNKPNTNPIDNERQDPPDEGYDTSNSHQRACRRGTDPEKKLP